MGVTVFPGYWAKEDYIQGTGRTGGWDTKISSCMRRAVDMD